MAVHQWSGVMSPPQTMHRHSSHPTGLRQRRVHLQKSHRHVCTAAGNIQTPHSGFHLNTSGPFMEGWYFKVRIGCRAGELQNLCTVCQHMAQHEEEGCKRALVNFS